MACLTWLNLRISRKISLPLRQRYPCGKKGLHNWILYFSLSLYLTSLSSLISFFFCSLSLQFLVSYVYRALFGLELPVVSSLDFQWKIFHLYKHTERSNSPRQKKNFCLISSVTKFQKSMRNRMSHDTYTPIQVTHTRFGLSLTISNERINSNVFSNKNI